MSTVALQSCVCVCSLHLYATGDSVKDTSPPELLSALGKMQHALLEEVEGDTCLPHQREEGEGGEDSSKGVETNSTLKELRTVVNSLLEILQPLESSTNVSV